MTILAQNEPECTTVFKTTHVEVIWDPFRAAACIFPMDTNWPIDTETAEDLAAELMHAVRHARHLELLATGQFDAVLGLD